MTIHIRIARPEHSMFSIVAIYENDTCVALTTMERNVKDTDQPVYEFLRRYLHKDKKAFQSWARKQAFEVLGTNL